MKTKFIVSLILLSSFLFQTCKKTDERLTKLIYGTWYLRESMGMKEEKYVFTKPDLCEFYTYSQTAGLHSVGDSLTFTIDDALLTIYSKDTIFQQSEIKKLTRTRLHLKYDGLTYVYKDK